MNEYANLYSAQLEKTQERCADYVNLCSVFCWLTLYKLSLEKSSGDCVWFKWRSVSPAC